MMCDHCGAVGHSIEDCSVIEATNRIFFNYKPRQVWIRDDLGTYLNPEYSHLINDNMTIVNGKYYIYFKEVEAIK